MRLLAVCLLLPPIEGDFVYLSDLKCLNFTDGACVKGTGAFPDFATHVAAFSVLSPYKFIPTKLLVIVKCGGCCRQRRQERQLWRRRQCQVGL